MTQAFIYTRNRLKKLREGHPHEDFPTDFFFGAIELQESGAAQCELFELEASARRPFLNDLFGRIVGVGNHWPYLQAKAVRLERFEWLNAVGDAVALGLASLKDKGALQKSKIRYFAMGLMDRLWKLQRRREWQYVLLKPHVRRLLMHMEEIAFLGRGEEAFFQKEFPELRERARFVGFGVDTKFWRPNARLVRHWITFVGNDANRDFDVAMRCANELPEQPFRFVSQGFVGKELPANVTLHVGTHHSPALTEVALRELYQSSKLVILPIRDTLQPSGQSVALQSLACGTRVLITRNDGTDFFRAKSPLLHLVEKQLFLDQVRCLIERPYTRTESGDPGLGLADWIDFLK